MSRTIHASCVEIDGRGVLLAGRSGSGKSDLALRLIDRGARLVSDDYTELRAEDGRLIGSAPEKISGMIEMRGIGIVPLASVPEAPVALHVRVDEPAERLPEPGVLEIEGVSLPSLSLPALEASAPIKVEQALRLFGLPLP